MRGPPAGPASIKRELKPHPCERVMHPGSNRSTRPSRRPCQCSCRVSPSRGRACQPAANGATDRAAKEPRETRTYRTEARTAVGQRGAPPIVRGDDWSAAQLELSRALGQGCLHRHAPSPGAIEAGERFRVEARAETPPAAPRSPPGSALSLPRERFAEKRASGSRPRRVVRCSCYRPKARVHVRQPHACSFIEAAAGSAHMPSAKATAVGQPEPRHRLTSAWLLSQAGGSAEPAKVTDANVANAVTQRGLSQTRKRSPPWCSRSASRGPFPRRDRCSLPNARRDRGQRCWNSGSHVEPTVLRLV